MSALMNAEITNAAAARRATRMVSVGGVRVGADAPVVVQSMTNTDTADHIATAIQVAQLARAGSELVRLTVNNEASARAVPKIREQLARMNVEVPLVGDFHYNGHTLLTQVPECAEALAKLRINPGNVGAGAKRDPQFAAIVDSQLADQPALHGVLGRMRDLGIPVVSVCRIDENGDAWMYDSTTNAYYLHYFSRKQPDLNWENPKVRQEVYDIMKFWAEKGVDGFRLDAFQFVSKDTTFPPLPEGYEKDVRNVIKHYGMGPRLHEYLEEMNREVLSKYDVFAVSEGAGSTFQDAHDLVDADRNELQMAYHFEGVDLRSRLDGYELSDFKDLYTRWDSAFAEKGWLSIFLANHDQPRMVNKFGNDAPEFRAASSKMLNTFILSMRGTPYCYYGDELGMTNIGFDSIEQYQDIAAINGYKKVVSEGGDVDLFLKRLKFFSRDNGRTPMQWDDSANAGFTDGTPWLPVNPNYGTLNVAAQEGDPNSCLNYFRKMVKLRRENPVLVYGAYELLFREHPQVYAYTRTLGEEKMLVLLNFSAEAAELELPADLTTGEILIDNYETVSAEGAKVSLQPYQAVIYQVR